MATLLEASVLCGPDGSCLSLEIGGVWTDWY